MRKNILRNFFFKIHVPLDAFLAIEYNYWLNEGFVSSNVILENSTILGQNFVP